MARFPCCLRCAFSVNNRTLRLGWRRRPVWKTKVVGKYLLHHMVRLKFFPGCQVLAVSRRRWPCMCTCRYLYLSNTAWGTSETDSLRQFLTARFRWLHFITSANKLFVDYSVCYWLAVLHYIVAELLEYANSPHGPVNHLHLLQWLCVWIPNERRYTRHTEVLSQGNVPSSSSAFSSSYNGRWK